MRSGFLLVSAVCVLGSAPGKAGEFKNPQVIKVRSPGGDLTIRARQGTAFVPGLGDVEGVFGYEVRRGASFPRGPPANIGLMPPVIVPAESVMPFVPGAGPPPAHATFCQHCAR